MTITPSRARPAGVPESLEVRSVRLQDPLTRPMLDELAHEYWSRYRRVLTPEQLRAEMDDYPAAEFAAPDGDLLLLLRGSGAGTEPLAGGAYRRRVEPELGDVGRLARPLARAGDGTPAVATAELKRIWTHHAYRRLGLARRVVIALEESARRRGYTRLYLTTGPRQPEAVGLYLDSGYTPLFDPSHPPQSEPLPFEKWLSP